MPFPTPSATTVARGFPDAATIQARSVSRDEEGGEAESWSSVYTGIPAQRSAFFPGSGPESELVAPGAITQAREQRLILLGDFPDITEAHRALVAGITYDITGVERDSWAILTPLRIVEREP